MLPSLSRAASSAVSEPSLEVVGSHHSPGSIRNNADPEPRPLCSTGVARLLRYYGPLRHPQRPGSTLTSYWLATTLTTEGASRVPNDFPFHACRRHDPGGIDRANVARLTRSTAAFPVSQAGRLPHYPFRGLLDVFARCGLHGRRVPKGPSTPKASSNSLPPSTLRLLPAGAAGCRVGFAPTGSRRLFTAHKPKKAKHVGVSTRRRPPVRGRGWKPEGSAGALIGVGVGPRAGARMEARPGPARDRAGRRRRPRAGARMEA